MRGNDLKLHLHLKGRFKVDIRRNLFTESDMKTMNGLSREVVESPSLEVCEGHIDVVLRDMFSTRCDSWQKTPKQINYLKKHQVSLSLTELSIPPTLSPGQKGEKKMEKLMRLRVTRTGFLLELKEPRNGTVAREQARRQLMSSLPAMDQRGQTPTCSGKRESQCLHHPASKKISRPQKLLTLK
ncbi:uncharacterized protein [Melanerpes formicivorus]|uniref:uncharacterized protein isoform X2 n=1 Tax=Melanerpes formicivorus TaxID=211600 RepID=UPI00359028C1